MYQVNFNVNNALNTPSIAADTFANRPTVAATGAVYIATDTGSMYRYNGTAWTSIGGGGISGTGTATYIPYWSSSSALGTTTLTFTTGGGYPTTTISGTTTTSIDLSQGDPSTSGQAAGFVVRRQANNKVMAFILGKDTLLNAGTPVFNLYAQDDFFLKVFGSTDYYHSFFKNGNVVLNGYTDAGFKLDVQGNIRGTADFQLYNTGNLRAALYTSSGFGTLDLYYGSIGIKLDPSSNSYITGGATLSLGSTTGTSTALLYMNSTVQGLRFPVMTTTQKNAITNTAGLVVFDSTLAKLCVNSGSGWQTITSV